MLTTITFDPITEGTACLEDVVLSSVSGGTLPVQAGQCAEPESISVVFSLENIIHNGSSGTVDLKYESTTEIGGMQFDFIGATLEGSSGGTVSNTDWTVTSSDMTWVGFSFSGQTIPMGSNTATSLSFTLTDGSNEVCANNFVATDALGNQIGSEDAGCIPIGQPQILGCMDVSATNYSSEATFDDGSCEFAPVVVEEVEELE